MSAWEVIKICAQYIWLHNVPQWLDWLKEMALAFALFGIITAGVIPELRPVFSPAFVEFSKHAPESFGGDGDIEAAISLAEAI